MSLEVRESVPCDFFNDLWCPMCGGRQFTEHKHAYILCEGCYAHVEALSSNSGAEVLVRIRYEPAFIHADSVEKERMVQRYTEELPCHTLTSLWHRTEHQYVMVSKWGRGYDWDAAGPE